MEEEWAEIGRKREELAKQVGWDDADDDMGGGFLKWRICNTRGFN